MLFIQSNAFEVYIQSWLFCRGFSVLITLNLLCTMYHIWPCHRCCAYKAVSVCVCSVNSSHTLVRHHGKCTGYILFSPGGHFDVCTIFPKLSLWSTQEWGATAQTYVIDKTSPANKMIVKLGNHLNVTFMILKYLLNITLTMKYSSKFVLSCKMQSYSLKNQLC